MPSTEQTAITVMDAIKNHGGPTIVQWTGREKEPSLFLKEDELV